MDFNEVLEILIERRVERKKKSEHPTVRDDFKKKNPKYKIGDRVVGMRADSPSHGLEGELVKQDVTVNRNLGHDFRNPCYHVKCDKDGKIRKYQAVKKIEKDDK